MLRSILDAVMHRRAGGLVEHVGGWVPTCGPMLDFGSGTGHLAVRLEEELGLEVVTADVSDMHLFGRAPILIDEGALPFADGVFAAAVVAFVLAYPVDPVAVLTEVSRVTRGPVIVIQTLYEGLPGYLCFRVREFVWSRLGFRVSKLVRYIPPETEFTLNPRRFYTAAALRRDVAAAGLRIRSTRERPVLPGRRLVVAGWALERNV